METVSVFVRRMRRIGIDIELFSNCPWIYIDRINGKKVTERYEAEHGFTAFFYPVRLGEKAQVTSISEIFKLVRKYV